MRSRYRTGVNRNVIVDHVLRETATIRDIDSPSLAIRRSFLSGKERDGWIAVINQTRGNFVGSRIESWIAKRWGESRVRDFSRGLDQADWWPLDWINEWRASHRLRGSISARGPRMINKFSFRLTGHLIGENRYRRKSFPANDHFVIRFFSIIS